MPMQFGSCFRIFTIDARYFYSQELTPMRTNIRINPGTILETLTFMTTSLDFLLSIDANPLFEVSAVLLTSRILMADSSPSSLSNTITLSYDYFLCLFWISRMIKATSQGVYHYPACFPYIYFPFFTKFSIE